MRLRGRACLAALSAGIVLVPVLVAAPAPAAAQPDQRPQQSRRVKLGKAVVAAHPLPEVPVAVPGRPVWPTGGTTVDLPPTNATGVPPAGLRGRGPGAGALVRVGSQPVWVGRTAASSPERVAVSTIEPDRARAAGRDLVVRVDRADGRATAGPVAVTLDVSGFRNAVGGDWADRLRLVALPDCALATPTAPQCTAVPLPSTRSGNLISADLTVAPSALVALTADTGSGSGEYAATSLSPSATWSAGSGSGGFSWSMDLRVPPALNGPAPKMTLGYSSQAVDGRTAATNNQPSWVGEGFDWSPGYIERRYVSCSDDMGTGANNTTKTGDQCWKTDNATMSLNGSGTELLYNATEDRWHGRAEDGSRIERLTGASNGDNNGEYWRVTATDGTQYYFGLNRLQGWTSGKAETNSVQTVPVFGNNSGEPCHQSTFTGSDCVQAYRWNLDYVVDPHGNTMSLWWKRDTNRYGSNGSETALLEYVRDAYLDRIDYGTHQRDLVNSVKTDTVFTAKPVPMRVEFGTGDRCLTNCWTGSEPNKPSWTDTPWDLRCTAAPCDDHSPAFWSSKRLSTITTRVWDAGTAGHRDVERWTLTHSYPDPGDGTRAGMWLQRMSHSGLVGGTATLPDIVFTPVMLDNRVDTALQNGLRPMRWARLKRVTNETGGIVDIDYLPTECVAGATPAPESNTKRCYPNRWTPESQEIVDWFHKYVVAEVRETDATGPAAGSPLTKTTRYEYVGGAAWRYSDDDGLTKDKYRTWNQWRGYETVRTLVGTGTEQVRSETRFFRGMHGDRAGTSGGSRVARLSDSKGFLTNLDDLDEFAGMTFESRSYDSPTGNPISGTVSRPWRSATATATRSVGGQTVEARFTGVSETWNWSKLDGGRPDRVTHTADTFDALGMVTEHLDDGDLAVTGDEVCALTDYARNTGAHLLSYQSRVRTYALTCAAAKQPGRVFTKNEITGEVRTYFDDQAWGVAPSRGETTRVDSLKDWVGNAFVPVTTSRNAYDDYGRVTDAWDVDGNRTGTAYTPAADGPVTGIATTTGPDWTASTVVEPAWGSVTTSIDVNNRRTDVVHDPLGRIQQVWKPGRSRATFPGAPSLEYLYHISDTEASAVETRELGPNGNYVASFMLYDSLLRLRQTQVPTGDSSAGAVVRDTFYDSAGRVWRTYGPYIPETTDTPAPSPHLSRPPANGFDTIDEWYKTDYDSAGRTIRESRFFGVVKKWEILTAYPSADRVAVTPAAGGTATSTVKDALGRTRELRQHHGPTPASTYDSTTYDYDAKGHLVRITNAEQTRWEYEYDILGRQTKATDPDKGVTTSTYDDAGRLTSTVDSRTPPVTLHYTYDPMGRKTGLYQGVVAPANRLAKWEYDGLTNAKGMQTSATRYVGGEAGAAYVSSVTALSPFGTPAQQKIIIPAGETGLAGTYTYDHTYKPNGEPNTSSRPFIGKTTGLYLGVETLTTIYNNRGQSERLNTTGGGTSYVTGTGFTDLGELGTITLRNNNGPVVTIGHYYEQETRRLSRTWVTRDTAPSTVTDTNYFYDDSGSITSIREDSTLSGTETQCFEHDHLRRLKQAWTPSSGNCAVAPTAGTLGGPAPYWREWEMNRAGSRTRQVDHAAGTTVNYGLPAPTAPQPHAVTRTTDGNDVVTGTYTYDGAGNTLTRPAPSGGQQTLTWDAEGHLASSQDGTGTTTYLYDANGQRLIRKDPLGKTLYLPGQELRVNPAGTTVLSCIRYYTWAGRTVAMRAAGATGLNWIAGDRQGSVNTTIAATGSQTAAIRRQDPYGNARGATTGSWPSLLDKGFVGGTRDNSGLTHLGAREYDPFLGRFISVDPIIDHNDPQQMNGYAYSSNSPVNLSDPDGLRPFDDLDGRSNLNGKRANPYSSDAEERAAQRNAAKAHRLRQQRYHQIMHTGYLGIRKRVEGRVKDMMDSAERASGGRAGGKGGAVRRLAKELVEDFTEDMLVDHLIKKALERIDESRSEYKETPTNPGFAFDDEEFFIAFELAFNGHTVESRDEKLLTVGNPDLEVFDAYVDDVRTEFKTLHSNKADRVKSDLSKAQNQHATRVIINVVNDDVEGETVQNGMKKFLGYHPNPTLKEIGVMGEVEANIQPLTRDLDCAGWDWWENC
ncbi:RHS repeat-associated core domain-containing protein [Micromonospora echinofusca]|uniref:Teneurin-like YD-shell domain-containing protein n=1 Tax=Micromonospora echinofusca TaxID=47858 RepID=A0ABS3VQ98_MICEH|nr:RHS repeat-associated core domain-containing protein [Micromonospora echinofusca]MBO4206685.1 hypothetical protein [Micromonospora echinofusca]